MTRKQRKIYAEALRIITEKFGHGGIKHLADKCGVPRPMVSATLNGRAHNPTLRRKLKTEFGIECLPFAPPSPLSRNKKASANYAAIKRAA